MFEFSEIFMICQFLKSHCTNFLLFSLVQTAIKFYTLLLFCSGNTMFKEEEALRTAD
jgi:hypothetical protein